MGCDDGGIEGVGWCHLRGEAVGERHGAVELLAFDWVQAEVLPFVVDAIGGVHGRVGVVAWVCEILAGYIGGNCAVDG